jgi:hypothetical protein
VELILASDTKQDNNQQIKRKDALSKYCILLIYIILYNKTVDAENNSVKKIQASTSDITSTDVISTKNNDSISVQNKANQLIVDKSKEPDKPANEQKQRITDLNCIPNNIDYPFKSDINSIKTNIITKIPPRNKKKYNKELEQFDLVWKISESSEGAKINTSATDKPSEGATTTTSAP